MIRHDTIEIIRRGKVGYIHLNRPEVHNAMNAAMIAELGEALIYLTAQKETRVIVIRGNGKSFSSGADLNYMKEQAAMSSKHNHEDSLRLAGMFYDIYNCSIPVITVSHGTIAGGANGIVAASDYALTTQDAVFRFSEVYLGLVPATIAPYVLDRVGRSVSLELMLSGKSFTGADAETYGLVNKAVSSVDLEKELDRVILSFLQGAPEAIKNTKKLLIALNALNMDQNIIPELTASAIAQARASKEGIEGISAFFEKRKPKWNDEGIQ